MADVAKKLSFDDTGGVSNAVLAQCANFSALQDLQKALEELRTGTQQRAVDLLSAAKQSSDGGGENDFKRLQRQFQTQKATFVNFDVKERFMSGLHDVNNDAKQQEAANKQHEVQLESSGEALRDLKAQNDQARSSIRSSIQAVAEQYKCVDAVSGVTAAQLDALRSELLTHESSKPAPESPLPPGPDEVECHTLLHEEMARAKQLESFIATNEGSNAELEVAMGAQEQELAALKAEVERLEALKSDMAKAADADAHFKQAAEWCDEMMAAITALSGASVSHIGEDALQLQLCCSVAQIHPAGSGSQRQVEHELALAFQTGTTLLRSAKLTPPVVPVEDILAAAKQEAGGVPFVVREVHCRLMAYWQRQALIEAAAEKFHVVSVGPSQPTVKAAVPLGSGAAAGKVEVEVEVPWQWPAESSGPLQVARVLQAPAGIDAGALAARVNGDAQLCSAGLVDLLAGLAAAATEMLDAGAEEAA